MSKGRIVQKWTFFRALMITGGAALLGISAWLLFPVHSDDHSDELAAIEKVLAIQPGFPGKPEKVNGIIHGGGPAPGIKVPGDIETHIEKTDKETFLVTLTEYWNQSEFHGPGGGDTDKSLLSHYWKYQVTRDSVVPIENGGDFPPQFVK